jgi:hypothetical protein
VKEPSGGGAYVNWATKGDALISSNERGHVTYDITSSGGHSGAGVIEFTFNNPYKGDNECKIIYTPEMHSSEHLTYSKCIATEGNTSFMYYGFRVEGIPAAQDHANGGSDNGGGSGDDGDEGGSSGGDGDN